MTGSKAALGAALGLLTLHWPLSAGAADTHHASAHRTSSGSSHTARASKNSHHAATATHTASGQTGRASIYANNLRGRQMADGTRYDPGSDTAASKQLPLGTRARVTNLKTGDEATVTVRDRGPYARGRVLDVSPHSADALGIKHDGVAPVAITPLEEPRDNATAENKRASKE